MTHSRLLTLDLATMTGWARAVDCGPAEYGSLRLGPTGCSPGLKFVALESWLEETITLWRPTTVVFEAPMLGRGSIVVAQSLIGFTTIVELVGARHRIPIYQAAGASVTKAMTGQGGRWPGKTHVERSAAKKLAVIQGCRRYGWDPADDNAADALAILVYAEQRLMPGLARKAPQLPAGPLFVEDAA